MTTFSGHFLGPDTHANRPSVTGLPNGTQYFCTTHSKVEHVVSGAWADYYSVGGTETLPVTIIDAKGDLIAGTAADTAARLAVGTDGQVLTADAASTPGVKWATAAGGGGAWTLLSTTTLAVATASIDVTSISGSYNDLICICTMRSNATGDNLMVRINNDSGGNYYLQRVRANNTTLDAANSIGATGIAYPDIPGTASPANLFSTVELELFGYASTTWKKNLRYLTIANVDATAGSLHNHHITGYWSNTAAITRVTFAGANFNLASGSQLRIYGRL